MGEEKNNSLDSDGYERQYYDVGGKLRTRRKSSITCYDVAENPINKMWNNEKIICRGG